MGCLVEPSLLQGRPVASDVLGARDDVIVGRAGADLADAGVLVVAEEICLLVGNRQDGINGLEAALLEGWPVVADILRAVHNRIVGRAGVDVADVGVLFAGEEVCLSGVDGHDGVDLLETAFLEGWPVVADVLRASLNTIFGRAGDDLGDESVLLTGEEIALATGKGEHGIDGLEFAFLERWPVIHDGLGTGDNVVVGGAGVDAANANVLVAVEKVGFTGLVLDLKACLGVFGHGELRILFVWVGKKSDRVLAGTNKIYQIGGMRTVLGSPEGGLSDNQVGGN